MIDKLTYLAGAACAALFAGGYMAGVFTGAETGAALLAVAVVTISIFRGKV
jgi:hypothetical protein